MTGSARPTPVSQASITTTTQCSSNTRAHSGIAGSSPSAHASTAKRATTPISAPSCRLEASFCRTAPACCRRSSYSATSDEASSRRHSPNGSVAPGSRIRVPTSKWNRRSRVTWEWSLRLPTSGSVRHSSFSGTTSPIRSRTASARSATAFPSTPTSTDRRRAASNWSSRYSARSPGSLRRARTGTSIPRS